MATTLTNEPIAVVRKSYSGLETTTHKSLHSLALWAAERLAYESDSVDAGMLALETLKMEINTLMLTFYKEQTEDEEGEADGE